MKYSTLKTSAIILLTALFFAPLFSTFIYCIVTSTKLDENATTAVMVLSLFNIPFAVLSGIALAVGNVENPNRQTRAYKISLIISIILSIAGIIKIILPYILSSL